MSQPASLERALYSPSFQLTTCLTSLLLDEPRLIYRMRLQTGPWQVSTSCTCSPCATSQIKLEPSFRNSRLPVRTEYADRHTNRLINKPSLDTMYRPRKQYGPFSMPDIALERSLAPLVCRPVTVARRPRSTGVPRLVPSYAFMGSALYDEP